MNAHLCNTLTFIIVFLTNNFLSELLSGNNSPLTVSIFPFLSIKTIYKLLDGFSCEYLKVNAHSDEAAPSCVACLIYRDAFSAPRGKYCNILKHSATDIMITKTLTIALTIIFIIYNKIYTHKTAKLSL